VPAPHVIVIGGGLAGLSASVALADLRLEVARRFWAVVTADAAVRVLTEGVARAQAHVTDVKARLDAGLRRRRSSGGPTRLAGRLVPFDVL